MWGNAARIARIQGFDIKIDASWLLIATLIVWSLSTAYFPVQLPGASPLTLFAMAVIGMLGLFGSLILHELAHAVVARHFGLLVSGITLFLFGGVAELQSEPASSRSDFWIAIAGPVASLCIALAIWFSAQATGFVGLPDAVQIVLSYLAWINLVLALFNMLPAFPMDGGRVLRAWLWGQSGDLLTATRRTTTVSNIFAYGLVVLGLYSVFGGATAAGLWPALIGLFLLFASRGSLAHLETKTAFQGRQVADLMTRDPWTVHPDQSLSEIVDRVFLEHGVSFSPVVENDVLLGYVDLQMVRKMDREHWATTKVEDVLESIGERNTVPSKMASLDLISMMQKTGQHKFLVTEGRGLVGVITLSDMLALLRVFRETT